MECADDKEGGEARDRWDRCIKQAAWKIGLGMVAGAMGSAFLGGNELPMGAVTGLVAGWSYNSCLNLLKEPAPQTKPACEDPCDCCAKVYEPLIRDQFEGCSTTDNLNIQEEVPKCTCKDIPVRSECPPEPPPKLDVCPPLDPSPDCTCDN